MFTLYIALLFRIISNPVANLIQKKLSNTNSTLALNLYSSLFMALLCSPFSFKVDFLSFGWNFYSLVLLSGFFCFMGTICLIKALKIGEMSVLGPINSYKSVIGLVFAFLLLKETPSIKALIGFLFIISASFLFADSCPFIYRGRSRYFKKDNTFIKSDCLFYPLVLYVFIFLPYICLSI